MARPNHYHLLGLEASQNLPSLPAHLVKAAYKRALLEHHPDKRVTNGKVANTVDDIALAYKTLSEPQLRSEYDRWLHSIVQASGGHADGPHHTGLETVDLDDLHYDAERSHWRRECRCGNEPAFIVTEEALESNLADGELIVGCKGCSLWLRVLFSVQG